MDKNEKPSPETPAALEEPAFGAWLRDQREKKKISLEEIAAVTKVHISQLQNIESGHNRDLPASAFVRGFLISYARHVGIDENEVLRRYRQSLSLNIQKELGIPKNTRAAQAPTNPKVKVVHTPSFQNAPGSKGVEAEAPNWMSPRALMALFGLVAAIAVISVLVSLGKKARNKGAESTAAIETTEAPKADAAAAVPSPLPTAPASRTATTAAPAAAGGGPIEAAAPKYQLELWATEATWLSVRVDESPLQSMTLRPGAPFVTGLQRRAQIYLSNAGVVELRWDGTWYESPGYRGDVRSLVLPDQLGELKPKTAVPVIRPRPKIAAPATTGGVSADGLPSPSQ